MKIKTVALALVAVCCGLCFAVDDAAPETRKRKDGVPSGGYLELANNGKVLQVVNVDAACPEKVFMKSVASVEKVLHFPFVTEAVNTTGTLDGNVAARVVVVNREGQSALICAPDDGWCEVNVKPLLADEPKEFILQRRLEKEILRALGFALGCGYSSVSPCVMSKVDSLSDLDSLRFMMGPESLGKTLYTARLRGCESRKYVSYRRACQEGWAPAPTNEVQQAIWEQIRAEQNESPSNPIRILPGQKPQDK